MKKIMEELKWEEDNRNNSPEDKSIQNIKNYNMKSK